MEMVGCEMAPGTRAKPWRLELTNMQVQYRKPKKFKVVNQKLEDEVVRTDKRQSHGRWQMGGCEEPSEQVRELSPQMTFPWRRGVRVAQPSPPLSPDRTRLIT